MHDKWDKLNKEFDEAFEKAESDGWFESRPSKQVIKELGDYLCENDYPIDRNLILKIKELLKKEKEQTIDFAYGCTQHISREDIETYYIKTFNNNKK